MGAVVTHSPVAGRTFAERVAVDIGDGEPGQVLADSRGVDPDRVGVQRPTGTRQLGVVGVKDFGGLLGQLGWLAAALASHRRGCRRRDDTR